jgi:hypothetical protein
VASSLLAVPATNPGDTNDRLVSQCSELVSQLKKDFSERDELYRYIDAVLYGEATPNIPKGFRKIGHARRNPLATYYCNTITAALTVNPPRVHCPVSGIGDAAQVNATLREHFFDASWDRQEEEAEAPLFRRFTHSVVTKGEGILKTVPRARTAWGDYGKFQKALEGRLESGDLAKLDGDSKDRVYDAKTEEYKRTIAPYPIRSVDVPPDHFYYWKGEDGLTLAVEHKRVPYLETLLRYGAGLDKDGRVVDQSAMGQALPVEEWRNAMSGTSSLVMSEVWTHNRCVYLLQGPGQMGGSDRLNRGTVVKSFKHRYGDPVTRSLRGPFSHCLGTTTSSRLPERAGLGVLYGFLDLFVWLDELLTIQQINAVVTGLAAYKRNAPPPGTGPGGLPDTAYGEDGLPALQEPAVIEPGRVFPMDISPIEQPRAGAALGETVQQVKEFIELILPKVLQGVVDTTDSGYQLALAARLGRIAFDPMVSNIRRAAARRVGFESWLIEHEIGETCYAWGEPPNNPKKRGKSGGGVLSIGPDDLGGQHRYRVHLEPEDKASELVEVRKYAEMVTNRFMSLHGAREALGKNSEEVEREILLQTMKDDPEIQALLKKRIMERLSLGQKMQQEEADAKLAQAAGPPPEPGAQLGGMGEVFEGGQNLPIEPGVPGAAPPVPAGPPMGPGVGGTPPGAVGMPPLAQQQMGMGV